FPPYFSPHLCRAAPQTKLNHKVRLKTRSRTQISPRQATSWRIEATVSRVGMDVKELSLGRPRLRRRTRAEIPPRSGNSFGTVHLGSSENRSCVKFVASDFNRSKFVACFKMVKY